MRILYACLIATSLVGAACSGDDGGSPLVDAGIDSPNPDAPPGGACGTIATTLSTYPANYAGSTARSTSVGAWTSSAAVRVSPPKVTDSVAAPSATPWTRPPATVNTAGSDDAQAAAAVTSSPAPSAYEATALAM